MRYACIIQCPFSCSTRWPCCPPVLYSVRSLAVPDGPAARLYDTVSALLRYPMAQPPAYMIKGDTVSILLLHPMGQPPAYMIQGDTVSILLQHPMAQPPASLPDARSGRSSVTDDVKKLQLNSRSVTSCSSRLFT